MAATTLGIIVGGLIAAQTANSVISDRKNAKAARKLGEANAGVAEQQAADALARGDEAVAAVGSHARGLKGAQRASFAAQGIEVDSGSAADVIANDEALSELDKLTLKRNAQREAHGYKLQANAYRKGGQLQAANYNAQIRGTLLSGAGQLLGAYQAFGKSASTPRLSRADTFDSPGAQIRGY